MKKEDVPGQGPPNFDGNDDALVAVPIEDSIDLHTFRPSDVKALLDDYLEAAVEKGVAEVRIIHGKGSGVLRERVRSILGKHRLVLSVKDAEASGGGWGATIARLRTQQGKQP